MAQLQAGYFLDSVRELFNDKDTKTKLNSLLHSLSFFDLQTNTNLSVQKSNNGVPAVIAVLSNLLSRGLPTRPTEYIENIFSDIFNKTKKIVNETGDINYQLQTTELNSELYKALHIIDPRIQTKQQFAEIPKTWENLDGGFENDFLFSFVPTFMGNEFMQLIEIQKEYNSILKYATQVKEGFNDYISDTLPEFAKQKTDFSIELPYLINNEKGIIIEIDGPEHYGITQRQLDNYREYAAEKANWAKTIRLKIDQLSIITELFKPLQQFTDNEYFEQLSNNYKNPLYQSTSGLEALQLALSPLAIGRIQKTILQFILCDKLSLKNNSWNIAVIEQDIPCAIIAINDLKQQLENLLVLEGLNRALPKIQLNVYVSDEFSLSTLNRSTLTENTNIRSISKFNSSFEYDLLIDISILQRNNIKNLYYETAAKNTATIKSVHSIASIREYAASQLTPYPDIIEEAIEEKTKALEYFLRNIFRKNSFLPGQIKILNSALQLKNLIALSTPNSGKSIAYQLAALLQPAMSMIIEPLESIIEERVRVLNNHGIDNIFVANNTSQLTLFKNKLHTTDTPFFIFALPEKIQTSQFRNHLTKLYKNKKYFAYCIIDKAYCLSEWSHDFKITYYSIANKLKLFCKSGANINTSLIGLSTLISYNVLTDLKNEFEITNNNIIKITNKQQNINYNIVKANIPSITYETPISTIQTVVGSTKQTAISRICKKLYTPPPPYKNSTLIICPHETGIWGITDRKGSSLTSKLDNYLDEVTIGYTLENTNETHLIDNKKIEDESRLSRTKFANNNLNILISTSEYGASIDKQNINDIIHFNIPNSIETFIQQTGRAGRNTETATNTILFNNQPIVKPIGNSENTETLQTTIDEHIHQEVLKKKYTGAKKEILIIYQLLTQITYPVKKKVDSIKNLVEDEFGEKLNFEYKPKKNPYQLHINKNNKHYGFIDYRGFVTQTEDNEIDTIHCHNILNFIKDSISKNCPTEINIFKWLETKTKLESQPGIEQILEQLEIGEQQKIVIHFQNDKASKLLSLLNKYVPNIFTKEIIKTTLKNATTHSEFVDILNNIANIEIIDNTINLPKEIGKMFYLIREKLDTFRAIYRLSIIGLVDDYLIDEKTGTVTLIIKKKNEDQYLINLYQYLEKYISTETAAKLFTDIESHKGEGVIQKSISYLLNFVYDVIVDKQLEAINNMSALLTALAKSNNIEKEFDDFTKVWFNAKYINSLIAPNLKTLTNNYSKFDFNVIIRFISIIGNQRSNWLHLKKSCSILLKKFPDSYVLLLLYAYVLALLEKDNDTSIAFAIQCISDGFTYMKEEENISIEEYYENQKLYFNGMNIQSKNTTKSIKTIVEIKHQTKWLSNFNSNFLEGYGKQN